MGTLLYHCMGLGDHLVMNGWVRSWYEKYSHEGNIHLLCKFSNEENVKWMFKDLPKLKVFSVKDDNKAKQIFKGFKGRKINGFEFFNITRQDITKVNGYWCYKYYGLNPDDRYNKFFFPRDLNIENNAYQEIIGDLKDYIFVADDPERGFNLQVKSNFPIIKAHDLKEYKLHELIKVMNKAKECHVMWSSIFLLLDALEIRPLFVHDSYLNRIIELQPTHPQFSYFINDLKERNITFI